MRYKFLFLVSVFLCVLLMSGTALAADPIHINSFDELMAIDPATSSGAEYKLAGDIDASGKTFIPIGTASDPFKGSFDGQGYAISNITYNSPTTDNVGLFGYTEGALISDLVLKNISLTGNNSVGGLIGQADSSSIINCSIDDTSIITGNTSVGGLVGCTVLSQSIINYSSAAATVSGLDYVGGLAGKTDFCNLYYCSAAGDVNGKNSTGGLVGKINRSNISSCFANGDVEGDMFVGGLIGESTDSPVSKSYATGNATGRIDIGGFAGFVTSSSNTASFNISQCFATGNATGSGNMIGGFIGVLINSSVFNSYATGDVEGNFVLGGFVGSTVPAGTTNISKCYATGNVTSMGTGDVGGFIGNSSSSYTSINDSLYIGTPNSNNNSKGVFVDSNTLMNISTFTDGGPHISNAWSISPTPDDDCIWYIDDGNSYPQLFWIFSQKIIYVNDSNFHKIGTGIPGPDARGDLRNWDLTDTYILTEDIDFAGENFTPIGTNAAPFAGIFNGNNYTISNIEFNNPAMDNVGLFGYTADASISYLSLENINLTGQNSVGALAGVADNTSITQCFAITTDASMITGNSNVGGLIGLMDNSSVSKSYVTGNAEGTEYVGGFVGAMDNSSVLNSYATGNAEGTEYVGGFVGLIEASDVTNSYATGIAAGTNHIGGFVGQIDTGFVKDSFYIGEPNSTDNTIGFFVTPAELKKNSTFTLTAPSGFVSAPWNITSLPDPDSIWYINEDNDYPKFYWDFSPTKIIYVNDSNFHKIGTGVIGLDARNNIVSWNLNDTYILIEDADFSGENYVPIGTNTAPFTGSFDGGNYTISNIELNDPTTNYIGLFGYTDGASVSNLSLKEINLTGNNSVGALIGAAMDTTVTNCFVTNSATSMISGSESYVGGLIGHLNNSSVSDSCVTSHVKGGNENVGGFVGYMENSSVSKSNATGDAEAQMMAGGFVGYMEKSSVSKSYANGNATGIGGIGGFSGITIESSVSESYANGSVIGTIYIGGFTGYMAYSDATNNYAMGNINGIEDIIYGNSDAVGGFVGYMIYSNATDSYAMGDAEGNTSVGGFVGSMDNSDISNSYAMGNTEGNTSVGGFVGFMNDSGISNSYAMGDAEGDIFNVGGFVGYMENSSSISKSYANGNVNGTGNYVGGFAGAMMTNSFISESYSNGDVRGTSHLGGFVGYIIDSDIANCYSMGNATGIFQRVGGFVGHMRVSTIKNSYAAGTADGSASVGGFVGSNVGTITDSFYIGEPSSTNVLLGFFVTPEILKKIMTFKTEGGVVSASWNITIDPDPNSIWYIDEEIDYPRFYWTYHPPNPNQNPESGHRTGGATIVNPSPSSSFEPQNSPEPDPVESPKPVELPKPELPKKTLSLIGLIVMLTAVLIAMTQGYKAAKLNSKGIENPNLIYQIIIVLAAIAAVIVFFMTSSLGGKIILLGIGGIIIALLFLVQVVLLTKFYLQKNKK